MYEGPSDWWMKCTEFWLAGISNESYLIGWIIKRLCMFNEKKDILENYQLIPSYSDHFDWSEK